MPFDPQALGLSWKDGILVGVIIGQWMNARARRDQGGRIGSVETDVASIIGYLGIGTDKKKILPPPPGAAP